MRLGFYVRLVVLLLSSSCGLFIQGSALNKGNPSNATTQTLVQTTSGPMIGIEVNGVLEFRGIPYAQAPVGALRWAPPVEANPWTEPRDVSRYSTACPQTVQHNLTEASILEDCLTLNISVPLGLRPKKKRPVFVWIHGGEFESGSSHAYRLDRLAAAGLIVVSLNYRLGVMGFLSHPAFEDSSKGNFGLLDQRLALKWVQKNIEAFGGDARNVTLAGESAGAMAICQHIASPEHANGLFHKAILVSAACDFTLPHVEEVHGFGLRIAEAVGCKESLTALECLRNVPVQTLLLASERVARPSTPAFSPVMGTEVIPRSFAEALQTRKIMKIPLMMGGARDEFRLQVAFSQQEGRSVSRETFVDHLKKVYESSLLEQRRRVVEKILHVYPMESQRDLAAYLGTIQSDYHPYQGRSNCLNLHTADQYSQLASVFSFEFADPKAPVLGVSIAREPDPKMLLGAVNTAILGYIFPNFSQSARLDGPELEGESKVLSEQLQAYWSNFAKSGNPNGLRLPSWIAYEKGSRPVLQFYPAQVSHIDARKQHFCKFWEELYPEFLLNGRY